MSLHYAIAARLNEWNVDALTITADLIDGSSGTWDYCDLTGDRGYVIQFRARTFEGEIIWFDALATLAGYLL